MEMIRISETVTI